MKTEHFTKKEEQNISLYFHISILLKGFISLLEILAGLVAIVVPLSALTSFTAYLAQNELSENYTNFGITNFLASHILSYVQHIPSISNSFLAFYLLSRGLIKVLLIIAMLKNKLWAYPSSIGVLGVFVLYQLHEILVTSSMTIIILTVFDLLVMLFIWEEYKVLRSRQLQPKKV